MLELYVLIFKENIVMI